MEHWSVIFTLIEKGLAGDTKGMRNYTELLLARLDESHDEVHAERLRKILAGEKEGRGVMLGIEPWFKSNGEAK